MSVDVQYCDLVKAIRRGKVGQMLGNEVGWMIAPGFDWVARREWVVPSYWLDKTVIDLPPEVQQDLIFEGQRLLRAGELHFPHASFVIISSMSNGASMVTYVGERLSDIGAVSIDGTAEDNYQFWADNFKYVGKDGKNYTWVRDKIMLRQGEPFIACSDVSEKLLYGRGVITEQDATSVQISMQNALLMMMLLNLRSHDKVITLSDPEETPRLKHVNAGRRIGKRKALPGSQRILTISLEEGQRIRWRTPQTGDRSPGAIKAPHDRRGHPRTYKATGKTIYVKPAKIRGGSTAIPPTTVVKVH